MRRNTLVILCLILAWGFQPPQARAVTADAAFQLEGLLAGRMAGTARQISSNQFAAAETALQNGVLIEWNPAWGTPQRLRGTNLLTALSTPADKNFPGGGWTSEQKAAAVLDRLAPLFDAGPGGLSFQPAKTDKDRLGFDHVRFRQVYRGLPVVGAEVVVHLDRSGRAYQVNGEAIKDPGIDSNPGISWESAVESAIRHLVSPSNPRLRLVSQPELVVFAQKSTPRLAFEVTLAPLDGEVSPIRWRAWIDAADGSLILAFNDIHFISPPSAEGAHAQIKGNVLAAEGGQAITVTGWLENSGVYYLHNTNWAWQVYNLGTVGPDAATYAYRFDDSWDLSDPTEISAARNFDLTQRYFYTMHGRRSFDDAGIFAQANVHYSQDYANAFWSGAAFYFGDGNGTTAGSMVTLDIAAHEYTHAVTDYSARLIYADESGALNESFSDIFGVCVEFFAQADNRSLYPASSAGTADWLMGEDCWLAAAALRDLREPHNAATVGSQRQPSRYRGPFWYSGIGDNGGVHRNSGVQNFFFYLLSEGGTGTNDGIPYTVTGIGITNAAQIAFRALTVYCTPATDYQAVRGAWISAAQDLDTNWVAQVANAWSAVGIGSLRVDQGSVVFRGPPGGPFACPAPEITLFNWGTQPLEWGLVSTQSWLQASPSTGSIPALGSARITLATSLLADMLSAGLYTNNVVFTNASEAGSLMAQVRLYIGQPDSYTEVFDENDFNLAYTSVSFTPDGSSSFYSVCREPAVEFPTDPSGGTVLALGDDGFEQLSLSGTNTIGIYGRTTNVFFLGSNGYLTLGSGDNSNLPTLANHFARPRVAALLNDLNPAEGGTVSWMEASNRVVITFQEVPVFGNPSLLNSFQVEMFYDGAIRITYLAVAFQNGLVGLSAGNGVPTAFTESHFSSYATCHPTLIVQVPPQAAEGDNLLIARGSVTIPFPVATNLFVNLLSSNTNEIWVQATSLILPGHTNVTFDLTIVDDTRIDGPQNVTVSASVPGWTPGQGTISILDNESTNLALVLPAATSELAGVLTNGGWVSIAGTLPTNLVVEVLSDSPSALQVPLEVTIPAGETSRHFDLTPIDNGESTGPVTVTVAASATGFGTATKTVIVADDETPPVPFSPSPANLSLLVAQTNSLGWQNGAMPGQGITNYVYFGTNAVPGPGDLLGFTTNTTWELPLLAPQTHYYWQVVAHYVGVTPGPVWQFTTRGVDHFEWSAVPSPQYSGESIHVTISARDEFGGMVSNFTGAVSLSAAVHGPTNDWVGVELTPTNCGTFIEGAWSGTLTLAQPATNLVLSAHDADGKTGSSNPFNVLIPNDLELAAVGQPASTFLGGWITNVISVLNTGPSNATGVVISNFLPATLSYQSAEASQGSSSYTNGAVLGDMGILASGEIVTLTVVTRPVVGGLLTNAFVVSRAETDTRPDNNFAETITEVISPALTVSNLTVLEGNVETNLDLVFQLSLASPYAVTVEFATVNGDAIAGYDFVSTNGSLTFNPGETNLTVPITLVGDTLVETNETFQIVLTNIANGHMAISNLTVTILNDDLPPPLPRMVLITEFDPANGLLALSLTNLVGSELSVTNVAVYRSTNLAGPDWEILTNQLVLTNGVLRLENLDTRGLPTQFFRARQIP